MSSDPTFRKQCLVQTHILVFPDKQDVAEARQRSVGNSQRTHILEHQFKSWSTCASLLSAGEICHFLPGWNWQLGSSERRTAHNIPAMSYKCVSISPREALLSLNLQTTEQRFYSDLNGGCFNRRKGCRRSASDTWSWSFEPKVWRCGRDYSHKSVIRFPFCFHLLLFLCVRAFLAGAMWQMWSLIASLCECVLRAHVWREDSVCRWFIALGSPSQTVPLACRADPQTRLAVTEITESSVPVNVRQSLMFSISSSFPLLVLWYFCMFSHSEGFNCHVHFYLIS